MGDILDFLREEGVSENLIRGAEDFRARYPVSDEYRDRIPDPQYYYYGKETWEMALAVLLAGRNLLLAGPKATGKNVLCENLAAVFGQPVWNVSFHINMDASYLIGTDTFDGTKVTFRPGPIYLCADRGGFGVLDEINMAKNESLAVLHSALDFRRAIDVPGYDLIRVKPQTRFIGTMNYGYAGTRELNEALSSRFAILSVPEISETDLDRLIRRSFPDINPKICTQFVKLFMELMRKTEKAEISDRALDLRGLLDALSLIREGLTAGQALRMCIVDKTFDAYEQSLIMDVVKARIPAELDGTIVFG
ncbi:MAG: MoxR family ATPase [Lachnospiraceae bacterium]|nr:MoxR family ATPase [Lachnospiraceae bacterium]